MLEIIFQPQMLLAFAFGWFISVIHHETERLQRPLFEAVLSALSQSVSVGLILLAFADCRQPQK